MILKSMKIWINVIFLPFVLFAQDTNIFEKKRGENDSIFKSIPHLDSVLYSIAGLNTNEFRKNIMRDSLIVSIKKNVEKHENELETWMDLFELFKKDETTRNALMYIYAEMFLQNNTTMLVMGVKNVGKYWIIRVLLSHYENNSIVDDYTYLCMEKHKMWFCSGNE